MTDSRTDPPIDAPVGDDRVARGIVRRVAWMALGFCCVAVGSIGIVVPGLPTTVFFIAAAAAFARSDPRLEAWVLGLPKVGRLVQDYRAGLGMPRSAKITAITVMSIAITVSCVVVDNWVFRGSMVALGIVGVVVILRQPTRD